MNNEEFIKISKQLADEHWEYVQCILADGQYSAQIINLIGKHYKLALVHGFKHGIEYKK